MTAFNPSYSTKALIEEILTPAEYIKLSEAARENIKFTQIIPPKLGARHFGKIKVVHKTPIYVVSE